jgi:uncharacterized membrane protein
MKNASHHRWLAQQMPNWIQDGLITSEQAAELQKRHPAKESLFSGRMLINTAAAIMVGLGVIALFAFNWEAMPKALKLTLIFAIFAGAHIIGVRNTTKNPIVSETAHALGTMFMGAAIFLVSQIYHLSDHYPNAFILWSIGALALAWAKPSLTQAFMALILISMWHLFELMDFNFANPSAFPIVLLGITPLVFKFQSAWLARYTSIALMGSVSLTVLWLDNDFSGFTLLYMTAILIFSGDLLKSNENHLIADIGEQLAGPAKSVFIVLLFLFSFEDFLREMDIQQTDAALAKLYLAGTLIGSQILFFITALRKQLSSLSKLVQITIILALLPAIIDHFFVADSYRDMTALAAILFNLIILVTSIVMMLHGSRGGMRKEAVTGALLFGALVMMRFVDLFDSLILRGLAFVAIGIFLFWIARRSDRPDKSGKSSEGGTA